MFKTSFKANITFSINPSETQKKSKLDLLAIKYPALLGEMRGPAGSGRWQLHLLGGGGGGGVLRTSPAATVRQMPRAGLLYRRRLYGP